MGLPEKVLFLSVIAVIISLTTIKCSPRNLKKTLLRSIIGTDTAIKDEESCVPLKKPNNIRPMKPIKNMLYRKFVPYLDPKSENVKEAEINLFNSCDNKENQPVWTKTINSPKIDKATEFCKKFNFPAIEYPSFDNPDDPYGINDGAYPEAVYPVAAEDLSYLSRFKLFPTKTQTSTSSLCNKPLPDINCVKIKKNLLRKTNPNSLEGKKNNDSKNIYSKQCLRANNVLSKYLKHCYVAPSPINQTVQSCTTFFKSRISQTTCPPSTNGNSLTSESTSDVTKSTGNTLQLSNSYCPQINSSNNINLLVSIIDNLTCSTPDLSDNVSITVTSINESLNSDPRTTSMSTTTINDTDILTSQLTTIINAGLTTGEPSNTLKYTTLINSSIFPTSEYTNYDLITSVDDKTISQATLPYTNTDRPITTLLSESLYTTNTPHYSTDQTASSEPTSFTENFQLTPDLTYIPFSTSTGNTILDQPLTESFPETTTEQLFTITYFTTEPWFTTPSMDNNITTQPPTTIRLTTVDLPDTTDSPNSSTNYGPYNYTSTDTSLTHNQTSFVPYEYESTTATTTLSNLITETTSSSISTRLDSPLSTSSINILLESSPPYYESEEESSQLASETSNTVTYFTETIQNDNLIKSTAQTMQSEKTSIEYTYLEISSPFTTTTLSPITSTTENFIITEDLTTVSPTFSSVISPISTKTTIIDSLAIPVTSSLLEHTEIITDNQFSLEETKKYTTKQTTILNRDITLSTPSSIATRSSTSDSPVTNALTKQPDVIDYSKDNVTESYLSNYDTTNDETTISDAILTTKSQFSVKDTTLMFSTNTVESITTSMFSPSIAELESQPSSNTYATPTNEMQSTLISSIDSSTYSLMDEQTYTSSTMKPDSMNSLITTSKAITTSSPMSPSSLSNQGFTSNYDEESGDMLQLTSTTAFPTDSSESSAISPVFPYENTQYQSTIQDFNIHETTTLNSETFNNPIYLTYTDTQEVINDQSPVSLAPTQYSSPLDVLSNDVAVTTTPLPFDNISSANTSLTDGDRGFLKPAIFIPPAGDTLSPIDVSQSVYDSSHPPYSSLPPLDNEQTDDSLSSLGSTPYKETITGSSIERNQSSSEPVIASTSETPTDKSVNSDTPSPDDIDTN